MRVIAAINAFALRCFFDRDEAHDGMAVRRQHDVVGGLDAPNELGELDFCLGYGDFHGSTSNATVNQII
jgi:hypothetical protein